MPTGLEDVREGEAQSDETADSKQLVGGAEEAQRVLDPRADGSTGDRHRPEHSRCQVVQCRFVPH